MACNSVSHRNGRPVQPNSRLLIRGERAISSFRTRRDSKIASFSYTTPGRNHALRHSRSFTCAPPSLLPLTSHHPLITDHYPRGGTVNRPCTRLNHTKQTPGRAEGRHFPRLRCWRPTLIVRVGNLTKSREYSCPRFRTLCYSDAVPPKGTRALAPAPPSQTGGLPLPIFLCSELPCERPSEPDRET